MENLKDLVRNDLKEIKEKEIKKRIEINSKLDEITLYVRKGSNTENPSWKQSKMIIDHFDKEGVKYNLVDLALKENLSLQKYIHSIVQSQGFPIIFIKDNYLVNQRDFSNPQQAISMIQLYADPEFTNPPLDLVIRETLKNLGKYFHNQFTGLNRQLQPVIKIMNELAKEENEEKNN